MPAGNHLRRALWRNPHAASWLLLAALATLAATSGAQAQTVYKCRDPAGRLAYQDQPCAASVHEVRIEIAKPPPPAPSPDYAVDRGARAGAQRAAARRASVRRDDRRAQAVSYECRADDGEVFYRHSGCPHSLRISGGRGSGTHSAAVSAVPISRSEACRRLAAAGSIGRAGHQHDEQVSTYDRNAGRDACRRS